MKCTCCGQTIKAPKTAREVLPLDTSAMTDTQLFAYYKRTAPVEDIRFWIGHATMSDALLSRFVALSDTGETARIKRELPALQAEWRREANARERQAHLDAGDVLVDGFWTSVDLEEVA